MKFGITQLLRGALPLVLLLLSACGGGGSGGSGGSGSVGSTSSVVGTQMGGARQGVTLNLASSPATVSTLAGANDYLNRPQATASDGVNVYVADTQNNVIRQIVIATGAMTTLAGGGTAGAADGAGAAATFNQPKGIAVSGGTLYVADTGNNLIRQVAIASGAVTTLAGSGAAGTADGAGAAATFNQPIGITVSSGQLYVTDNGSNLVRQISIATGVVSTLAGSGAAGAADGTGTTASFSGVWGITTDGNALYVAEMVNRIVRKIAPASGTLAAMTSANAVVSTLAGDSSAWGVTDATGTAATFNSPFGIATDGSSLYVADYANSKIRKIAPSSGTLSAMTSATAVVSSLTGASNTTVTAGLADGAAASVSFNQPVGLGMDGSGNLYVADAANNAIRKVLVATGDTSTLVGLGVDGTGTGARFDWPSMGATDGVNLYMAECGWFYTRVRKIEIATGKASTLAGNTTWSSLDGVGTAATFNCPGGITTDGSALYVVDYGGKKIRKIAPASGTLAAMSSANAVVTTLAGSGTAGAADGTGTAATFSGPWGITSDGLALYVLDYNNNTVRKIMPSSGSLGAMTSANAAVTTLAGSGAAGYADGTGTAAMFNGPNGITTDGKALYVAEMTNHAIRKIAPSGGTLSAMDSTTAVVTTLAGTGGVSGAADGVASGATFNAPSDITTDGTNLYVDDCNNNKVRMIVPTGGATLSTMTSATASVSSITGTANTAVTAGHADGAAAGASFNGSQGITTDGISLFVSDSNNNTVRRIK